jgi:hypothetical protein
LDVDFGEIAEPPDSVATDVAIAPTAALTIWLPPEVPAGVAFPVRAALEPAPTGVAQWTLKVDGEPQPLRLHFGRGSLLLPPLEPGVHTLAVESEDFQWAAEVTAAARDVDSAPPVVGADARWTAARDVRIDGECVVAEGAVLTVGPGARVWLGPGARLVVDGTLLVEGTSEAPTWFLPATESAWGELTITGAASLSHAVFTGGGGDSSRAFGHSDSQPVVRVDGGELQALEILVSDCPGKAFGAEDARVEISDSWIVRVDTGGEFERTELHLSGSLIAEIPDANPESVDDDNDGLYLRDARMDNEGEAILSTVERCIFSMGEDDGIDHNEAQVAIRAVRIEGFAHEGIAASKGREVLVEDSVVRGCEQGIEAGYGAPAVRVIRTVVSGNEVGFRFGDDYDWEDEGSLHVENSVALGNTVVDLLNSSEPVGGPVPGALTVTCSRIGSNDGAAVEKPVADVGALDDEGCPTAADQTMAAPCGGSLLPSVCQ